MADRKPAGSSARKTAEPNWLRNRDASDSGKVGFIELFFDLVFVFAVTQLSHLLLEHFSYAGALEAAMLAAAMWWVWIHTTWVTNWLDPERLPVRLLLLAMMLLGLVLSAAIPKAFDDRGLWFAGAYVAMQVGRALFFVFAVRGDRKLFPNAVRLLCWMLAAAVPWLVGATQDGSIRIAWWLLALGIDSLGPAVGFYVFGYGKSEVTDWDIGSEHLGERCGLFLIIALGESILLTGETLSKLEWNTGTLLGFLVAFAGTLAMWWVYFDISAERAVKKMTESDQPGKHARTVFTYLHLPIVAGVMLCAVADELLLTEGHDRPHAGVAAVIVGGPALYLLGNAAFKWVSESRGRPPLSHMAGLGLLAILAVFAIRIEPLPLSALAMGALVVTALWEAVALRLLPPRKGGVAEEPGGDEGEGGAAEKRDEVAMEKG